MKMRKIRKHLTRLFTVMVAVAMFMSAAPAVHAEDTEYTITITTINGTRVMKNEETGQYDIDLEPDETFVVPEGGTVDLQYCVPLEGYKARGYITRRNGAATNATTIGSWGITTLDNGGAMFPRGYVHIYTIGGNYTVDDDTDWEVEFQPIEYAIIFDGNGATGGSMESKVVKYDQELALPACGYTNEGKVFAGWTTAADGSGDFYADGETVKNLKSEDATIITLYAQWTDIKVNVQIGDAPEEFFEDLATRMKTYYPMGQMGEDSITIYRNLPSDGAKVQDMQRQLGLMLGVYGDKMALGFGRKQQSEYTSKDELFDEYNKNDNEMLTPDYTFYTIWAEKATIADFSIEKPVCGTKVTIVRPQEGRGYQDNGPVITAKEESQFVITDELVKPFWTKETEDGSAALDGDTIVGGQDYTAFVMITPTFGYYVDLEDEPEINFENAEISNKDYFEGMFMYILNLKVHAEHAWGEPEYEWADDYSEVTATRKCTACGAEDSETVPATGVTTDPKCEDTGKIVYTSEEFENEVFKVQTAEVEIKPTGHVWGEWKEKTPATCEEKGLEERVCENDPSHTETRETDALGHDYGDWEVIKEPTEEDYGLQRRVCKNDPDHIEEESIPPLWYYYYVEEGYDGAWVKGSGKTYKAVFKRTLNDEKTFKLAEELYMDDLETVVPSSAYTLEEGSLIVTLDPGYLETLSNGEHYLIVKFSDDWYCACLINIVREKDTQTNAYVQPKTGVE